MHHDNQHAHPNQSDEAGSSNCMNLQKHTSCVVLYEPIMRAAYLLVLGVIGQSEAVHSETNTCPPAKGCLIKAVAVMFAAENMTSSPSVIGTVTLQVNCYDM